MKVTVKYINQPKPGKKMGSIGTECKKYINMWPNQLEQFSVGSQYDVPVETGEWNGNVTYKLNGEPKLLNAQAHTPSNSAPANSGFDEDKQIKIWTQGVLQALIQSGQVGIDQIVPVSNALKQNYHEVWNASEGFSSSQVDELDDQIPF
jgi:hypothetical protein